MASLVPRNEDFRLSQGERRPLEANEGDQLLFSVSHGNDNGRRRTNLHFNVECFKVGHVPHVKYLKASTWLITSATFQTEDSIADELSQKLPCPMSVPVASDSHTR
ncbi:Hypothetical protein NTJ_05790 [Nesidiocoris tenuis]|nr:Hypothetical protein NTJ_05790 [Nesidiocoris tenuis]